MNVVHHIVNDEIVSVLECALARAQAGRIVCLAIVEYGPRIDSPKREVRVSFEEPEDDPLAVLALVGGILKLQGIVLKGVET